FCFFFSSRRRHTRFSRDWSSDVCSSDLWIILHAPQRAIRASVLQCPEGASFIHFFRRGGESEADLQVRSACANLQFCCLTPGERSEERRVGKECRVRGWAGQ